MEHLLHYKLAAAPTDRCLPGEAACVVCGAVDNNKSNDWAGRDSNKKLLFSATFVCAVLWSCFAPCNDDAFVRFVYERDWFYN